MAMERPKFFLSFFFIFLLLWNVAQADDIKIIRHSDYLFGPLRFDLPLLYGKASGFDDNIDSKPFRIKASTDQHHSAIEGSYQNGRNWTLKTIYIERLIANNDRLLNEGNRKGQWKVQVNSTLLNKRLTVDGRFGYSAIETGQELGKDEHKFSYLDIKGSWYGATYGLGYRFAGKEFINLKPNKSIRADREETQLWVSWGQKRYGIRASITQSNDNVIKDPFRPRLTDSRAEMTFEHRLLSWPFLRYAISYFEGTRKSSQEPQGYRPYERWSQSLNSSIYYSRTHWSTSLHSSYQGSKNLLNINDETITLTYHLSGSYSPGKTFSITPSLRYVEEQHRQDRSQTLTRTASLSVDRWRLSKNTHLTTCVSYYSRENKLRSLDTEGIDAQTRLTFSSDKSLLKKLSFYGTFNHRLNKAYPGDTGDFKVGVALELEAW